MFLEEGTHPNVPNADKCPTNIMIRVRDATPPVRGQEKPSQSFRERSRSESSSSGSNHHRHKGKSHSTISSPQTRISPSLHLSHSASKGDMYNNPSVRCVQSATRRSPIHSECSPVLSALVFAAGHFSTLYFSSSPPQPSRFGPSRLTVDNHRRPSCLDTAVFEFSSPCP